MMWYWFDMIETWHTNNSQLQMNYWTWSHDYIEEPISSFIVISKL